jgi:hypothetical protein
MNIQFNPPQLEAARQSETLCRLVHEMAPRDFQGELRVMQNWPDEPTRLVLIKAGSWPASIEMPRGSLYSELSETDLRDRLAELMHCFANPGLAA